MRDLNAVIQRHVNACLAEVRAEIEAEIRAAIGALAAREKPVERAKPKRRVKSAVTRDRRGKSKPVQSSAKPEPPQPVRRSATCSECDEPGHNARTCPQRERAVAAPPVDETRAQRFARIEAAAARRNGAAA